MTGAALGSSIGPYVLEDLAGEGGMGAVYRVRHRGRGTLHALKLIHEVQEDAVRRFLREGRAQAVLRHPHVVDVSELLRHGDSYALILEYVDGPSLREIFQSGGPGPRDADTIATQVLAGLAAVHARGVVHRDMKPANILVCATDAGPVAKIADFGLARLLLESSIGTSLTASGMAMGTLGYMSPEQILDASDVDARADVFALGAVLYELATGQRAFGGGPALRVVNSAEVRYESSRVVSPALPERMHAAIEAALQREPEARAEDASVLGAIWRGERVPVPRRPPTPPDPILMPAHPPLDELLSSTDPTVQEHLRGCPRCWTDVRLYRQEWEGA